MMPIEDALSAAALSLKPCGKSARTGRGHGRARRGMDFASDNATGASPEILAALVAANDGTAPAYGADRFTERAEALLRETFECDCTAFLTPTGTAANALAIAALTPPWGAVFCHYDPHVSDDECGAPEFFSGGAKLVGLAGGIGKITAATLTEALALYPRGLVKQAQPAALSFAQATEYGTVYTPAEIAELAALAHAAGVGVHMDGARFANALVTLGCSPAAMSWKAGVDILCLGATKNGALACEAVIFFDPDRARDFAFRRKRGGHTLSKGRFLGAQMAAYLAAGHWLDLAARANRAAARLADGLAAVAGVRLPWPREANEVFAILPRPADAVLKAAGARYYDWSARGLAAALRPAPDEVFIRLVASFATRDRDVDLFVATVRAAVQR
jgi:threonine aldolase